MFLVVLLGVISLSIGSPSAAVELGDNDFSLKIVDFEVSLVMFYAPWCRHCKNLKPHVDQAASALLVGKPPVMVATVDCTGGGKETCKRFGITQYPTLHIYKKGNFIKEYEGPHEAGGIEDYMKEEALPHPREITSKESLESFLNLSQASVIGFFKNESPLKEHFIDLAQKLRKLILFGVTNCSENLIDYENKVVLFRPKYLHNKFEPSSIVFEGNDIRTLENFILRHKHGLVGHRTKNNVDEFKKPIVVAYFNVDYTKNPKGTNYWRNRIMTVAKLFSNEMNFAISAENEFPHELSEFGYEYDQSDDKPIIFARDADNKKYKMTDEFSLDSFKNFLMNLKEGNIKPYLKSSPILDNDGKVVKTAVANNFDGIVTNNGKDTLIGFYAPWCVYCQNLEPIYEELGRRMAEEEVIIVKMDAVNNDIPGPYEVKGYPTLYWAPKNSKEAPVKYEGGRELDDLIKYIAKHATVELQGYDRDGVPKHKDEL